MEKRAKIIQRIIQGVMKSKRPEKYNHIIIDNLEELGQKGFFNNFFHKNAK